MITRNTQPLQFRVQVPSKRIQDASNLSITKREKEKNMAVYYEMQNSCLIKLDLTAGKEKTWLNNLAKTK
jgi:hypothetical protein